MIPIMRTFYSIGHSRAFPLQLFPIWFQHLLLDLENLINLTTYVLHPLGLNRYLLWTKTRRTTSSKQSPVTIYLIAWPTLNAELPQPVRHLAAPDADDVPIPHSALSKSPLRASPKPAPTRRRRSTGSHLDKAAAARNISRSRSSSVRAIPRDWTPEDLAKLRELKKDTKARPNWNTVAGKLARSPDDCKKRWKKLKAEDAKK